MEILFPSSFFIFFSLCSKNSRLSFSSFFLNFSYFPRFKYSNCPNVLIFSLFYLSISFFLFFQFTRASELYLTLVQSSSLGVLWIVESWAFISEEVNSKGHSKPSLTTFYPFWIPSYCFTFLRNFLYHHEQFFLSFWIPRSWKSNFELLDWQGTHT